jgi:hypothetical protein
MSNYLKITKGELKMKHLFYAILVILIISSLVFGNNKENYSKDHWAKFTKNSVIALKSNHDGIKQAAMVNIIRFKDKLDLNKTIFPLVNIYNNHQNEKMRELAVVALYQSRNEWAMNYLKENFDKESNPKIKRLILSCLLAEKENRIATLY